MDQKVILNYEASGISDATLREWYGQVAHEMKRVKMVLHQDDPYQTPYASLAVPYDDQLYNTVISAVQKIKQHNPTLCIVVGIGGSSLGTRAVYDALNGSLYNMIASSTRLQFVETIDSDYMTAIERLILHEIEQGGSVVLNVVSKSGRTIETAVNFEILFAVLKSCYPHEYANRVVITTDKDSPLAHCAAEYHFSCLYVPQQVGGRYSVFSAVSLFPLGLVGVDLEELRLGAQQACADGLQDDTFATNLSAINACITYAQYQAGIQIADMFLFSTALESVGRWWRQLVGESLGKRVQNSQERVGILPTVSIGSTDLHSVAQLYLGGNVRLLTTFVTVAHNNHDLTLSPSLFFNTLGSTIHGKRVSSIMSALVQGTLQAYEQNGNPFTVMTLAQKKEYEIGYFLQSKMLEVIYLGFLLQVNPFDQPDVERYKRITREILAHE